MKNKEVFPLLFEGGSAKLALTEPENSQETGVEFMISSSGRSNAYEPRSEEKSTCRDRLCVLHIFN
jgi:chromosome segregation ATPase